MFQISDEAHVFTFQGNNKKPFIQIISAVHYLVETNLQLHGVLVHKELEQIQKMELLARGPDSSSGRLARLGVLSWGKRYT